jgi:hypothetical protein
MSFPRTEIITERTASRSVRKARSYSVEELETFFDESKLFLGFPDIMHSTSS